MNENLQSLLEQATYEILGVKQVDQKKFAALIIRQCANIAQAGTAVAVANVIKEHFGVDE